MIVVQILSLMLLAVIAWLLTDMRDALRRIATQRTAAPVNERTTTMAPWETRDIGGGEFVLNKTSHTIEVRGL